MLLGGTGARRVALLLRLTGLMRGGGKPQTALYMMPLLVRVIGMWPLIEAQIQAGIPYLGTNHALSQITHASSGFLRQFYSS